MLKLDHDIKGALGKDIPEKSDTQLAKIQATVLASAAPLINFWAHLLETEVSLEDQIPAGEVVQVMQDCLVLIGNASNYVSQARRNNIIQTLSKSRPKLGSFMKDMCNDNLSNTRGELFGPDIRERSWTERAQLRPLIKQSHWWINHQSLVPAMAVTQEPFHQSG